MDFELSEEQEALRRTVRRFLGERAPLSYVRGMLDDDRGTTDEVWRGLADLGVTGLLVPEEHGGAGMGMVDAGVVLEELGRVVHPGPFLASAVAAVSTVVAVGSSADRADLLPGLAEGSMVGTLALLEPDTRAGWREPGVRLEGERLSGTKVMVPDAVAADIVLVSAACDDGLGVFAVDARAGGVRITPTETVDGTRKHGTVALDGAPGRRLGGRAADATDSLALVVDRVLAALVVDGLGAAEVALDMAVAYAKERTQFDRPIGSFQAVQHLCADMLLSLELGRAGAYYALWAVDEASRAGSGGHEHSPAEAHRAATMAKAFAGDAFFRIGANAIQVFGGIGFTWEHDVHLFYKRLLTLQQAYGTATEHLEELADLVLAPVSSE
jgi:alkylation response protein AidB-like acyl-CoA dehydrogenase